MKTILGVTAAAAALFLAASAANAQDDQECMGGYRMLPNEVPIVCDDGGGFTPMLSSQPPSEEPLTTGSVLQPTVEEPLYTGSIAAPAAPAVEHRTMMVEGPQDCRPGAYWLVPNPGEGQTPIACPQ